MSARAAATSMPGNQLMSNERSSANLRAAAMASAPNGVAETSTRTFQAERTTSTWAAGSAAPLASRPARTVASRRIA